jgi:Leucine-rich repeat (LRR) protein
MFILFLSILHLTISQDIISSYIFSDCKHLILPTRCQCYHSGHESQLRCLDSGLHSLPKLPNNMRWNALDFSSNYITSVDNYVFADIYVEKISLTKNYLRRIEITAFDQIKNLKQLFMDKNQLKELQPQALASPGSSLGIFFFVCYSYKSENLLFFFDNRTI